MANDPSPQFPAHDFDQISSLGKYKIQRKVGSGGMGAVYLAVDQQLKRTVALKVLPQDKASNLVLVRRFKAEGQAGAQLEHPNIVSVYESGEIDGYLYLAMEFVEGIDAFELLRKRGVLPVKRSLDIIKQVTLALQHAHERQIVHRDIKPSNLMIRERDGVVKLADMGLARIIEDDGESAITKAGTTVGTVDYMSPEQGRDSKAADIRSDIYSLGCTWYHLLAGKAPYPEGDLMNKLRAHALQPVPDPRNWNEGVPAGVVAVLQRMMAKKVDDRYQTPAQLLADLNSPALLRGEFSADQLQMLAADHVTHGDPEEDDEDSEEVSAGPQGARRRPVASQPGRTGKSSTARVERSEPGEEDEPDVPVPTSKSKAKVGQVASRESLPARKALAPSSAENDGGKRAKPERALPGRIDKPLLSEPPSTQLDPNTLKLGILGLVVLAALGGVLYSLKYYNDMSAGGSAGANPYATGEAGVTPPPATPVPAPPAPIAAADPSALAALAAIAATTPPDPAVTPSSGDVSATHASATLTLANLDRTPFGGEIPFSADGTAQLPEWVWFSRSKAKSAHARVIRRGNPNEGEFRDLAMAQTNVARDAVFEFADVGPHEIPALELNQLGSWILRGADGIAPVLILRSKNTPIHLGQGTLTLEGVHLVVMPEQSTAGIRVGAATLRVQRSTLTHLGPAATEMIVAEAGGRILLENAVVRGMGACCPVVLKGANSALVAGQSLLIAGNAATIQVESSDAVGDTRLVTLVSSACLSGVSGVACVHTGKQPPQCDINLLGAMLAYLPGHSADAIGVQFSGWPTSAASLDRPRVPFVKWAVEKSAFVGWPHWAQLGFADGTAAVDVRDEDAWRAFWRQPSTTGTLIPVGADLQAVSNSGGLVSSKQIEIGLEGIRTQLGNAGPKWSQLPDPPQSVLSNVIAFGQSPSIAGVLESPDPGASLRYDLKKPALGQFINSEKCPDGSTVVAFGSGLRTIDPFVVRQKRIQILFEQTEGTPLKIQPGYKTEPGATRAPAWFIVEDGQLTITNGSLLLTASKTRTYPERFLLMQGGLVAIRNCRVEGGDSVWPMLDAIPSEGHAPPQLLIDKSLVAGMKSLVRVGAAESVVEVRSSVLWSSAGVGITLDSGAVGTQCFLNGSTLSAGKSVYQVLPMGPGGPVGLFSRESVYQGGGVMSLETDASAIHWWGVENAYASGMKTFLLSAGTTAPQDFTRDWVAGWGAGHELLPVFGVNSTILPSPPANLADAEPESFQLNSSCAAADAGPSGAGLGAVISQVGPSRKARPPAMKPTKNVPVMPKATTPDF